MEFMFFTYHFKMLRPKRFLSSESVSGRQVYNCEQAGVDFITIDYCLLMNIQSSIDNNQF